MKKLLGLLIVSVFLISAVSAEVIFEDDFDTAYTELAGLPLYAEMNAVGWEIYDYTHPVNDDDFWRSDVYPVDGYYLSIRDDSHIIISVDTRNYENIELSYDRRTYSVPSYDELEIAWRVGDSGDWTDLEVVQGSEGWESKTWSLPTEAEGEEIVQVRFLLDDDNDDYGHVDNVLITGDYVPRCEANFYNPEDESWINSHVLLEWEYSEDCQILDQELYYHEGSCDANGVSIVELDNSGQRSYEWATTPYGEGEACVCIYGEQRDSLPGVEDCTNVKIDLTPPEVSEAYVSDGPYVTCEEGESCKSYVTDESKISFACTDAGSGVGEKLYRYRVNGGDWTEWDDATGGFYLPEESEHEVEYYCVDNVGKEAEHRSTIFIVDLTAPEITKSVGEPKVEAYDQYDWYVNTDTQICVTAEDQEPHPVGSVEVYCSVEWNFGQETGAYKVILDENGCFNFNEDSYHRLFCEAVDGLGNTAELEEFDIVDSQAPETTLSYEGPVYENEATYIDGVTTVVLSTEDPEPHPVGVEETQYRVSGALADSFCEPQNCANWMTTLRPDMGEWQTYADPFTMEESCHVIEYRSIDKLGNEEDINWECVYVDKTAPEPIKVVGEPAHDCNGAWELLTGQCEDHWDWLITMDTEVEISCEDQEPHPSGVQKICYRVIYDGELVEEEGANQEGYLCVDYQGPITLQFNEECEHQLDFYCVDNVEKTSEVDSELFKVEGRAFDIDLYKKWNLISIPFTLISSNVEEVFDSISDDVEIVWSYDETGWHVYSPEGPSDLEEVLPGYGYWVKMKEDAELTVGGSLLGPAPGIPPSRELQQGWNLIGHYGTSPKEAYCSLFSLIDTTIGYPRWSSLIGYNAVTDHFIPLDAGDITRPGKGYWVEMDVEDTYNPATACWGLP